MENGKIETGLKKGYGELWAIFRVAIGYPDDEIPQQILIIINP